MSIFKSSKINWLLVFLQKSVKSAQNPKSWRTHQGDAGAKAAVVVVRATPAANGAAHELSDEPEGAAPQNAGHICRSLQIFTLRPLCSPRGIGIVTFQAPRPLPDVTT